ncbi:hypothetical protein SISNIDRAFT_449048 [Sistotremastrum niveocremeum HHB9708]|uniref:Nas2 N-terminal domain-containing protein n=1 Tax=Sistotremastrum niveocremeum HHB9708 TaxID=1314777 RepID=A0A164Z451_9AGAM|nr:hypothetical protein SISNIDRAFT_449048 [Sistotremastrum niveocremeum HHB9708]
MSSSGAENGATGAREHALKLMERKDLLQAELDTQMAILAANGANMNTALVDGQGFPVASEDVFTLRFTSKLNVNVNRYRCVRCAIGSRADY